MGGAVEGHSYTCRSCGEVHTGLSLAYGTDEPDHWNALRWRERRRSRLTDELCVVRSLEGTFYYIRARLEIPILDWREPFAWGVWCSLSERNYARAVGLWDRPEREHEEPCFGWLGTELPVYPVSTLHLKTLVRTRSPGFRPLVEVEPTGHPLAVEQQEGITLERVREIAESVLHSR